MFKHKITAHYVAVDLIDFEADKRLFEETEKHGMQVEWLINNAGFGSMGDFAKLDLERELDMIGLNIMALVALTHRYLQKMRERKSGVIINVSSAAGFQPIPFMATYAATKAFVTSFSEAVAEENRPHGIKVLALCPGATETGFFDASNIKDPLMVKGTQTPEEVVETALKAVERGKSKTVSGWSNYIGAVMGKLSPDALTTRVIGNVLRPKFEDKKE
jgi:short-subunit dehydrogenase